MVMEKKTTEQKSPITLTIILIILAFLGVQLFLTINDNQNGNPSKIPENWHVEVTAKTLPIQSQLPVTLQVIIMDEDQNWVSGADVTASIQAKGNGEVLSFVNMEDGLYETAFVFSTPGVWEGTLMIEKDQYLLTQHMMFTVR